MRYPIPSGLFIIPTAFPLPSFIMPSPLCSEPQWYAYIYPAASVINAMNLILSGGH